MKVRTSLTELARAIVPLENPLDWRVTDYEDTREIDFDTGKRIPGSGTESWCGICGARHEIHVTISNQKTGQHKVVGSSCALKAGVTGAQYAIKREMDRLKSEDFVRLRKGKTEEVAKAWGTTTPVLNWLVENYPKIREMWRYEVWVHRPNMSAYKMGLHQFGKDIRDKLLPWAVKKVFRWPPVLTMSYDLAGDVGEIVKKEHGTPFLSDAQIEAFFEALPAD